MRINAFRPPVHFAGSATPTPPDAPSFADFKPAPAAVGNTVSSLSLTLTYAGTGGGFQEDVAEVIQRYHPQAERRVPLATALRLAERRPSDEVLGETARVFLYLQQYGNADAKGQVASLARTVNAVMRRV